MIDEQIIEWYKKGFHDEIWGSTSVEPDNSLLHNAYALGEKHALWGDDVRSFDYLPNEEIIKQIKNKTNE